MQQNDSYVSREEFKSFFENHLKVIKLVHQNHQDAKEARDLLYDIIGKHRETLTMNLHDLANKIVVNELNEIKAKNKKLRLQNKNLKSLLMNKGKQ